MSANPMTDLLDIMARLRDPEHGCAWDKAQTSQTIVPYTLEEDEGIPQEIELQISRLAAAASAKLLQRDQNEMAARQAQQAAQDPLVQIQQQEMAIKAKEVEIKEKKLVADAAAKADQLQIERDRIESQEKIAGMNATLKAERDKQETNAKYIAEGLRIGIDAAKANKEVKPKQ